MAKEIGQETFGQCIGLETHGLESWARRNFQAGDTRRKHIEGNIMLGTHEARNWMGKTHVENVFFL